MSPKQVSHYFIAPLACTSASTRSVIPLAEMRPTVRHLNPSTHRARHLDPWNLYIGTPILQVSHGKRGSQFTRDGGQVTGEGLVERTPMELKVCQGIPRTPPACHRVAHIGRGEYTKYNRFIHGGSSRPQ